MLRRTGFGNCDDMTRADRPGQRDRSCRAIMGSADTGKRRIAQQAGAGAAERRIGHHRHAVRLAPWQQVTLDRTVAEVVGDLIGRAAIAVWGTEEVFHVTDLEVGHAQVRIFPAARRFSNPATTLERSASWLGQWSK